MDKQTKILLLIILVIIILVILNRHNEYLDLELEDGQKCKSPGECKSRKCKVDGTCGYVGLDKPCADDSECTSRLCNSVTKKCSELLEDNVKCDRDGECVSGMCLTTKKPKVCHTKFKIDEECSRDAECENKSCINKRCQSKIADNSVQECKGDYECQSDVCNFVNKKCGLKDNNNKCNRHKECTSGYCKAGLCTNKPQ